MLFGNPVTLPVFLRLGGGRMGRPDAQLDKQVPTGNIAGEQLATNHGLHPVADVLGDQPGVEALFSGDSAGGTVVLVNAVVANPALTPVVDEELALVGGEQHSATPAVVTLRAVFGHSAAELLPGRWNRNGKCRGVGQALALHRVTQPLTGTHRHAGEAGTTNPEEAVVTSREKLTLVGREQFASDGGVVAGVAVLPDTALHLSAGDVAHLGFSGEEGIHG